MVNVIKKKSILSKTQPNKYIIKKNSKNIGWNKIINNNIFLRVPTQKVKSEFNGLFFQIKGRRVFFKIKKYHLALKKRKIVGYKL